MKQAYPTTTILFSSLGHLGGALSVALCLRLVVFLFYIYPNGYYNQPDSPDYHHCAVSLANNNGMNHVHLQEPIFWRTPGYPLVLLPFYKFLGYNIDFTACHYAHWWILFIQILLCSLLPLLIGYFIFRLSGNRLAASIGMWWAVFHVGFVLSSTFLLSDGLACLPFLLYLIILLAALTTHYNPATLNRSVIWAVICLGIYTWMRPNGQFMIVITLILIACSQLSWRQKLRSGALSLLVMSIMLMPWIVRNYTLTGKLFFCPMSGAYLQTFSAPKILSRLSGQPLVPCIQALLQPSLAAWMQARHEGRQQHPILYHSKELICGQHAWPLIYAHPWWFMQDWLQEATKTTFDLYSYQLVACAQGTFFYDPPQEFLSEKLAECLYKGNLPKTIRLISWAELVVQLGMWFILFTSFFLLIVPHLRSYYTKNYRLQLPDYYCSYWLMSAFIALSTMGMSGGFGYARLRLAIEPLLIGMSVLSALLVLKRYKKEPLKL